jgi:AcrR family transcriptional regulator
MNSAQASNPRRKTGRPLSFDREKALDQAMLTFWRHGYETTSIVDLTHAMGITAPSLYTAFGDKKQLFLEAARRYAGDPDVIAQAIQNAPSAQEAARQLLTSAATGYTGETTPKGCLLASAAASGSDAASDVQRTIADIRKTIAGHLRDRIERDISTGVVSATTDAGALAAFVMAVTQGMSVLARDGASRAELLAIVTTALQAWPQR